MPKYAGRFLLGAIAYFGFYDINEAALTSIGGIKCIAKRPRRQLFGKLIG